MSRLITPCVVALVLAGSTAGGQPDAGRPDLAEYRSLIDRYRDFDQSVIEALAASMPDALAARADLALQANLAPADLRAAALMHTEQGFVSLKEGSTAVAYAHLSIAGRLVDGLAPEPGLEFARRWYADVEASLRVVGAVLWADEFRERERARFPFSEARREFGRGLEAELNGASSGPRARRSTVLSIAGLDPAAFRWFEGAERQYARAAALDPDWPEAALHLGRVRMLVGRLDEATQALTRAAGAPSARVSYLARLFLGAIAERQGRLVESEDHYRGAMQAFPWGQSGPIALAQLLSATGREGMARAELASALTRLRGRGVDPLWTYLMSPQDQPGMVLDELRAEVWR